MGHTSVKTDAFSFGIILLELFTNTSPTDARGIVEGLARDAGGLIEDCEADLVSTAVKQRDRDNSTRGSRFKPAREEGTTRIVRCHHRQ